jgi:hypothetical protein
VEKLGRLDADAVAAVANSTVADVMAKPEVLPLRTLHSAALREHALERRVAVLESQIQEQEAALRRVLTLLVGWVEGEPVPLGYHRNAA